DPVRVPYDTKRLWGTLDLPGIGSDIGRGQGYQTSDGRMIPTIYPPDVNEKGALKLFDQRIRFFMPRIGIAWRPTNQWVVRAGAGWFDNINHLNTWTIFNLMPPKSGSLLFSSNTNVFQTIQVPGADGGTYPATTRQYAAGSPVLTINDPYVQTTGGTATVRPSNVLYVPPNQLHG